MNAPLRPLLQRPDVWRMRDRRRRADGLATGFRALDAALHGGGWPRAALTEVLADRQGIGELRLLMPLLRDMANERLWQLWIDPPFTPYAPALQQHGIDPALLMIVRAPARQQLWACEQALRSAACGAVLFWPAAGLRYNDLRKLQVAAAAQQCAGFLLRDSRCAQQPSPAALRLQLRGGEHALQVEILKQRGGNAGQQIAIAHAAALQMQAPIRERPAVAGRDATLTIALHDEILPPAVQAPLHRVNWQ